jgi:hypothetical protein
MEKVNTHILDFTYYIDAKTRSFIGREWVFDAFFNWLNSPSDQTSAPSPLSAFSPSSPSRSQTFLILGGPGSGKTAIASRLVQYSQGSAPPMADLTSVNAVAPTISNFVPSNFLSAIHFCDRKDRHWIDPLVFTESLALQLAQSMPAFAEALINRTPDSQITIEVDQRVESAGSGQTGSFAINSINTSGLAPEIAFERLVIEPIDMLGRSSLLLPEVLILVDGLDEASDYSRPVTIISLITRALRLTSSIRFILTSREDPQIMSAFSFAETLFLSESNPLTQQDIRSYVSWRLSEDTAVATRAASLDPSQREALVEIITGRAEGDFLFARMFLDDAAEGRLSLLEQLTGAGRFKEGRIEIPVRALADRPSHEDLLGFRDYAMALADLIRNERTEMPLTIVIDAAWGMGKTSLMDMIRTEIVAQEKTDEKAKKSILTVWFNAWQYDNEESLWAAFILELLNQIRGYFTPWERLQFWWKLNSARLNVGLFGRGILKAIPYVAVLLLLGGLIVGISWFLLGNALFDTIRRLSLTVIGVLSVLTVIYTAGKEVYARIIQPFDLKLPKFVNTLDYRERVGFLAQFKKDLDAVIKEITEEGGRQLIVFIDDLDRCAPPKPVEIIEAINLLLPDANHCVFILGMDSSAVAASIEVKYKDLSELFANNASPGELTLGQRFLEKIVQINFRIPSTDVQVVESFINTILAAQQEKTVLDSSTEKIKEAVQLIQDVQRAGNTLNSSAQTIQQARPDISPQAIEKAKQDVFARTFDKDESVRNAIHEAAQYLGYNPRKIKRFINTFRLQALIANRRSLLENGIIQLSLLAKWNLLATRWPSFVEAMLANDDIVDRLQEAYAIQEDLRQKRQFKEAFVGSQAEKDAQSRLDECLDNPYVKRLVDIPDLLEILHPLTAIETQTLPYYLHLTQTTVTKPAVEELPSS